MSRESRERARAAASRRLGPSDAESRAWLFAFGAWLLASMATLGALFFGEIMRLPPCSLCWYQRVFMFPLALILPFGLFPFSRRVLLAALPLPCIGGAIAAFQTLLVAGIVPKRLEPCTQGVACSESVIQWFGFVTIPLLSFVAFVLISLFLYLAYDRSSE